MLLPYAHGKTNVGSADRICYYLIRLERSFKRTRDSANVPVAPLGLPQMLRRTLCVADPYR